MLLAPLFSRVADLIGFKPDPTLGIHPAGSGCERQEKPNPDPAIIKSTHHFSLSVYINVIIYDILTFYYKFGKTYCNIFASSEES